ncbi:MAG TPA: M56 family metallopeptidase [Flavobacteriales bacterium]|nr:M56 family metallopeptidase [Flavobacteriales bacterium]
MEALTYYLKANLVFGSLFCAYLLVLRRETGFQARRAWLLLSPVIAVLLPLLPNSGSAPLYTIELPTVIVGSTTDPASAFSWPGTFMIIHGTVTVLLVAMLGLRILRAWRSIQGPGNGAASFLGRIRPPETLHPLDRAAIIAHEEVHVREHHSMDVLLFELVRALAWSNPLVHRALHELRLVHELIADRSARRHHPDYPALLLANAMGTRSNTLMTTFSSTNLKQRLIMLQNNRPPRATRAKLLLLVPALMLAFGLIAWQPAAGPRRVEPATVFTGTDTPAEFPGGMDALVKYLGEHVEYPAAARADGAEGTVYLAFVVKSTGELTDIAVKRGVRADIDAEALRVVKAMPAWKAARAGGKEVDSKMTLPIAFKLN